MRATLSALLILIVSAPTLLNLGALADYALRYKTYVEELCENKDRPELHCNGTCQLAKLREPVKSPVEPIMPSFDNLDVKLILINPEDSKAIAIEAKKSEFPGFLAHEVTHPAIDVISPPPKG